MAAASPFTTEAIAQLIDLDLYPVTSPDSPAYAAVIDRCRAMLAESGACELPGFLRNSATLNMAREADNLALQQYHSTVHGNAYLEPIDPQLPEDHAKRLTDVTALGVVAYDQFPSSSLLRQLYEWDPLKRFLADALGKPELYRYSDPMGALNLSVMGQGDYLRWHFDQTDFVVSIALQSSDEGGEFEYVPYIRQRDAENFNQVRALLKGDRRGVRTIPMVPGTLLLFEGRYSIHRVTHIEGKRLRHVALLGFDTKPGVMSTEHLQKMRYGRSSYQTTNIPVSTNPT